MLVGVPREIKDNEFRAGTVPSSVMELVHHGHQVIVQTGLGAAIGLTDADYRAAGATVVETAAEIYARAELLVKVKEPQPSEIIMLGKGQILFTYLHLAPDLAQTQGLLSSGVTAIAYETVSTKDGSLPLLAPMSEVAGRLAVQAGATCLEKGHGGQGILLGGVPGVDSAHVLIIGGGTVGDNAAYIASGMGAHVTILDTSIPRLRELDISHNGRVNCVFANKASIEKYALEADLVIGAVLVRGGTAPKLLTRDIIRRMRPGSVVVDVAIDQGGCFETSHPTTHSNPTFVVDGVVHYCVANMPGVVPRTSTFGLNNATLPYVLRLADLGLQSALTMDDGFRKGLNVHAGQVTCEAVAKAHGMAYVPAENILG
ncbi:MAG: alanine dehydrogenase [Pseudomonadota bacterium]